MNGPPIGSIWRNNFIENCTLRVTGKPYFHKDLNPQQWIVPCVRTWRDSSVVVAVYIDVFDPKSSYSRVS
jgi:hypothetical protein